MKKYYTLYAIAFGIIILLLTDIALRGVKIENPFRYHSYSHMSKAERAREDSLWEAERAETIAQLEHEQKLRDTTYLSSVPLEWPSVIEIGGYKFVGKPNSGYTDKYGERYRCYYLTPREVDGDVWRTLLQKIKSEVCNDRLVISELSSEYRYMDREPYISLCDRYLDVLERARKEARKTNEINNVKNGTVTVK